MGIRYETAYHPIGDFNIREGFISNFPNSREGLVSMNREGWTQLFNQLKEDDIFWKLAWWEKEEIIYCCGDFHNVPLMSPRGCINYNPAIALRQFAYTQKVPSEEVVSPIWFYHTDASTKDLSQRIKMAWQRVICKGEAELGKRFVSTTEEYRIWLKERVGGANPSFGPYNPLLGNDIGKVEEILAKRVEEKRSELKNLEKECLKSRDDLMKMHNEYALLQQEVVRMKRYRDQEQSSRMSKFRSF